MAKLTAKKKCCRDKPRCSACPVTLKRLADAGLIERVKPGKYLVDRKISKPALAAARAR